MPPLIHTFKVFDNHYVFDANTNTILSLNRQQWDIARAIEDGNVYVGEAGFLEDMQKQGYFLEPDIKEIEHPETNTLEYHLTRKIRKLTLQVTQNCNLRCDYCIYSGTYETRTHNKTNSLVSYSACTNCRCSCTCNPSPGVDAYTYSTPESKGFSQQQISIDK